VPRAVKLFEHACWSADQLAWSCNELGLLYLNGNGVAKDLDLAEKHFKQACFLGKYKHVGYDDGCGNARRLRRQRDGEP